MADQSGSPPTAMGGRVFRWGDSGFREGQENPFGWRLAQLLRGLEQCKYASSWRMKQTNLKMFAAELQFHGAAGCEQNPLLGVDMKIDQDK